MRIVFLGEDYQWEELSKSIVNNQCIRVETISDFYGTDAELYLYLKEDIKSVDFTKISKPILLNSVSSTLSKLDMPVNVLRINGWQTFLQRAVWEIAGQVTPEIENCISYSLQKKIIGVPDDIGFATARVVSMIINEAFFALEDGVSSKEEIDVAMKLGTNYPYGPFEWATKIGVKNIYTLLENLSETEKRYTPCSFLKNETA